MVVKPTTASPLLGRWTTRYTSLVGLAMHTLSHRQTASHVSATRLRRMSAVPCVDWGVSTQVGGFLVPPGVEVGREQAAEAVADLRAAAARAVEAVAEASALPVTRANEVLVVDRVAWVRAAVAMSQTMLAATGQQPPATLGDKVAARLAGAQLGAALAFVATRILGQFDPYSPPGRLLLVAPNIVAAERAMALEPHGFRQWVCLHEQTHRAQFDAAPWLPDHLLGLMRRMFTDDEPHVGLLSAGQGATFDSITAVMSLLEGHADVMMDRAAPGLVPQVDLLRRSMEARRDAPGLVHLIFRVLGLTAKREQYRDGARFCRAVLDAAGVDALNLAFAAPDLLPDPAELHDPDRWLRRVPARVG
jgi:uncharacterized protein (DUF2342 family)